MYTTSDSVIVKEAELFDEETTRQIVEGFHRNGYCFLVWHRGSPNNSDQVRYVGSIVSSQRVIAQRLHPFIDYRMPDHVWEGADARLQRLLGRHKKGAYG